MFGLLIAAVAGGVAGYYWRDNIREYMSRGDLRKRAADGLEALGERAGGALDRARSRIETTVRASQERLRATGTGQESEPRPAPGLGGGYDAGRGTGPSSGSEHRP